MSARVSRVLLGAVCALAGTAHIALAEEAPPPPPDWVEDPTPDQIAVDPVVVETPPPTDLTVAVDPATLIVADPPPEPYNDPYYGYYDTPVYPVDESPSESVLVTASAVQAWMSQPSGLEQMGRGGSLGIAWLQRHGDFPTGVEAQGVFVFGDRASAYDLSLRLVGSPKIGKRLFVPYAAIGLAVGASRISDARTMEMSTDKGPDSTYGFAIGPSASVGVHGFFGKKWYWRAGAGFVGAGIGAVTADLGVGIVVD